jgi:hypothetical protein
MPQIFSPKASDKERMGKTSTQVCANFLTAKADSRNQIALLLSEGCMQRKPAELR